MSLILKWALIALVVVWGLWSWRRIKRAPRADSRPEHLQLTAPCLHCGVHAARAEMVAGRSGLYCCIQHCLAHGDQVDH